MDMKMLVMIYDDISEKLMYKCLILELHLLSTSNMKMHN